MPAPVLRLTLDNGQEHNTVALLCVRDSFGVPCLGVMTSDNRFLTFETKHIKTIKVLPPAPEHW